MRGASLRLVIDEDEVVKKRAGKVYRKPKGEWLGSPPITNKEW